jgi:hypothetical protein
VDDFSLSDITEPSKTWITFFLNRIEFMHIAYNHHSTSHGRGTDRSMNINT